TTPFCVRRRCSRADAGRRGLTPLRHRGRRPGGGRDRKASIAEDISAANGGTHFSSTLADHRRIMFAIEPLSQSHPANFQLLLFRLAGTHSRVRLFAAPTFCRAKGNVMSTKLACSVLPTMEICPNCKSEMTIMLADGFDDVTQMQIVSFGNEAHVQRCVGAWEPVTLASFSHFDRSQAKPGAWLEAECLGTEQGSGLWRLKARHSEPSRLTERPMSTM